MPIIQSILDSDAYKFSMGACVFRWYGDWDVSYNLITRGDTFIPSSMGDALRAEVDAMADLRLTDDEFDFLRENCPYLKRTYLEYFRGYRFDPSEVKIGSNGSSLAVTIRGPWFRTIYWEVPLMALISELYFQDLLPENDFAEKARQKGMLLVDAGCNFADFGSRRRFSRDVHDTVVEKLKAGERQIRQNRQASVVGVEQIGRMNGTSNVWLAMKHGLKPIGTHAHEFFMAIGSQFGYPRANANALKAWQREFMGDLGIALTDTFTTDAFLQQFTMDFAKGFDGVRHDSGDSIEFAKKIIAHYQSLRINPLHKTIVFSDGLNTLKAMEINRWCQGKIGCSFGIGTHFTNNVGHMPLNMVIKLATCNGYPAIKLSDVEGKHTGDPATIDAVKQILGLNHAA